MEAGVPLIDDADSLQAIRYKRGSLQLLDQRKLPVETVYIDIKDSAVGWHAIKDMVVRGAPAIAISAALSLAVELVHRDYANESAEDAFVYLQNRLNYLTSSRPTAVNLVDASTKLQDVAREAVLLSSQAGFVFEAYVEAAENMLVADIATNKAIGENGANHLLSVSQESRGSKGLNILTHCNTGSLATAGYGTALGVIRSLHSLRKLEAVFLTETRPYNQGSRLTAYELVHEKIPATLVADSAAASLQMAGRVDAVIVGADRIAANGDTANKIGTYSLALAAFHHGIPFYVAAPLTSIDISLPSGNRIEIEQRSPVELTHSHGGHGPQIAATGISVWNPAFDVTPAKLITAIITEKGIICKKDGCADFDIQAFISGAANPSSSVKVVQANGPVFESDVTFNAELNHNKYFPLDEISLLSYIESVPKLAERLGGNKSHWKLREVGDGNLNYVFIVIGPAGSFVVKQALPYVRCVGESWPLSLDRSYYEANALKEHGLLSPEHVPEVYHFDYQMALTVMHYLEPPHIILRKGLLAGTVYPLLAEHMSDYMAKTLFNTSLVAIPTTIHKSRVAKFSGNVSLCRLTEQVIFSEPYMVAPNNHWTSPHLDEDAKAIRLDDQLKLEIAGLKAKFCESSQALIHGDLHTGSIMVTATSTQVIDPEFAFCGPMGFDVGAFLGNLLLAFFSQDGHASENDREDYKRWILQTVADSWNLFQKKFLALWETTWKDPGDAYPATIYNTANVRELVQKRYISQLFEDTLGFGAAKMIRRIVGIAHVEDLESITDKDVRAVCERRALNVAKLLLKERRNFSSIEQVLSTIQSIK
ncbi:hypothetical protein O6H91_08G019000 [Diphasiastrum complanatum]|uniref:Uncharacterized protein n=1 Tax=Diphasiastrum complanatum TaxID=34168 RepID=A0ACC2CVQ6_DIPCM|nr:hypothetical protein O6H91_08G019000 [Diphasiastrum complanatum]